VFLQGIGKYKSTPENRGVFMSTKVLHVRVPEKMADATTVLADSELTSVGQIVRKSLDTYLQDQGVDWRSHEQARGDGDTCPSDK
jgi:hypothetical protein